MTIRRSWPGLACRGGAGAYAEIGLDQRYAALRVSSTHGLGMLARPPSPAAAGGVHACSAGPVAIAQPHVEVSVDEVVIGVVAATGLERVPHVLVVGCQRHAGLRRDVGREAAQVRRVRFAADRGV